MRGALLFLILLVSTALTGCRQANLGGIYRIDQVIKQTGEKSIKDGKIDPWAYSRKLGDIDGVPVYEVLPLYEQAEANDVAGKNARNELIVRMMDLSEETAVYHLSGVLGFDNARDVVSNMTVTGLATAATIVTPVATKSLFSGLAGFVNASQSHFREQVYANQLAVAVIQVIAQLREERAQRIKAKMTLPTSQYDVAQAIIDVREFHECASFYYGVQQMTKAATSTGPSASSQIAQATQAAYQTMVDAQLLRAGNARFRARGAKAAEFQAEYDKIVNAVAKAAVATDAAVAQAEAAKAKAALDAIKAIP